MHLRQITKKREAKASLSFLQQRMVTTPSGATGPYVQQRAELEAAQEPAFVQILHRVQREMTALTWEMTPR